MFYNSKLADDNHYGPAVQRGPRGAATCVAGRPSKWPVVGILGGAATRAARRPNKRPMAGSPCACPPFCRKVHVLCGYFQAPLLTIAQEAHFSSSTPNKPILTMSWSRDTRCLPMPLRTALCGHAGKPGTDSTQ